MASITITLDGALQAKVQAAASAAKQTVEQYIESVVAEALRPEPVLTWKGEAALGVLLDAGGRPGGKLPLQMVQTHWWQSHALAGNQAMFEGLNELEAAEYIEPIDDQSTSISLTESGFEAARELS